MTDGMLESKLPSTGTSIFSVMSDLAQDCKAINLSQGFPSFNPDQELLDLVDKHIKNGANQYAPMPGVSPLLDAIAQKVQNLYGRKVEIHNVPFLSLDKKNTRKKQKETSVTFASRSPPVEPSGASGSGQSTSLKTI